MQLIGRGRAGCAGLSWLGSMPARCRSKTIFCGESSFGPYWAGMAAAFCQAARAANLSPAASAARASLIRLWAFDLSSSVSLLGRIAAGRLRPASGSAGGAADCGFAPGIGAARGTASWGAADRPRRPALGFVQEFAELLGRIDEPRRERVVFHAQLVGLGDQPVGRGEIAVLDRFAGLTEQVVGLAAAVGDAAELSRRGGGSRPGIGPRAERPGTRSQEASAPGRRIRSRVARSLSKRISCNEMFL